MYHHNAQAKPVTKNAHKLETEINEIKAKLEQLKDKYEELQFVHTKNHKVIKDFKPEQSNPKPQDYALEDRLQKVINELSLWVAIKTY